MRKMEETGPDGAAKRQRLDTNGVGNSVRRTHQQRPESSIPLPLHSHSQGSTLNPPNAYRQSLPHPPFTHGEGPPVPEQPPHGGFVHGAPTHHPSPRDTRSMAEQQQQQPPPPPNYGRPSISTPIRSPEEGHPLRPLSTSFAESEPQHYQQHPNPEMGDPQPSYTPHEGPANGFHHGLPMPHHQHDTSHAPPPGTVPVYNDQEIVHPHPGQHPGPHHYAQAQYAGTPTSAGWNRQSFPQQAPKRSARAQQACDNCRQRKAKCDEGKPTCSYCKETNQPCNYKEVQPAKADRAQKEIMDRLDQHQDRMDQYRDMMEQQSGLAEANQKAIRTLDNKFDRLFDLLEGSASRNTATVSPKQERESLIERIGPSHPSTPKVQVRQPTQDDQPMQGYSAHDPNYTGGSFQQNEVDTDENQEVSGQAGAVAVDHSTGVHRLLSWPSINSIITSRAVAHNIQVKKLSEDYVMEHETTKGLLRLYGRGQGVESYDGGSTGSCPSPALSSTSNSKSEESARSPAASLPDTWGANLGHPNIIDGRFSNGTTDDHPGGLNSDGTLKLDKTTMDSLYMSYLENIHVLHPFLDKTRLRRMFDKFYQQAHPVEGNGTTRSPHVYNSITYPDPIIQSRKRKHSTGESPRDSSHSESSRSGPEPILERRIWVAIVLLVMALGKMCANKDFLSGPAPDRDRAREMFAAFNTSSPSNLDSPSARTSSSRIGSPTSAHPTEGRFAPFNTRPPLDMNFVRNPARPGDRNVDVIPGLAYYTKATEILGYLQGGTDLLHVQATLLASLYMGQIACSIEAWSWIYQACKSCLFIMRGRPFKGLKHERVQLILFAYWTCFQFESDILAELDLRPSGIDSLAQGKEEIRYPQAIEDSLADGHAPPKNDFNNAKILFYYSAQINMRTTLNQIQKLLYPTNSSFNMDQGSWKQMLAYRNNCLESLQDWRNAQPGQLIWNDHELPANNILDARLRGKYWGTLYIINRPLLNYALRYPRDPSEGETYEIMRNVNTPSTNWTWETSPTEIMRSCKMCVFAATRSTTAFDGIMRFVEGKPTKRPIVTNIFGTAHAQFGNMLVLAAVYRSHLHFLISKDELVSLLNRTIHFLTRLSPISNTLRTDACILTGILQLIEFPESITTSFSSNM